VRILIRSYRELIRIPTFAGRYEYLKLKGVVGASTFGSDRYLNQILYNSIEWKRTRTQILLRDEGCDLGIPDREIFQKPIVHHMNPITIENIENRDDCVFDPDNLITTSFNTHNAITYGDSSLLIRLPTVRRKGDTCPWKVY